MHFSPLSQGGPQSPNAAAEKSSLSREVVYLGIAQIARYWGIGSLMLGKQKHASITIRSLV